MSSLGVRIEGKRYAVKTTPMTKLQQILEDSLRQAGKGSWSVQHCSLMHARKKLDLDEPIRFANIPAGANLEVEYCGPAREPALAQAQSTDWQLEKQFGQKGRSGDAGPATSRRGEGAAGPASAAPQPPSSRPAGSGIPWDVPSSISPSRPGTNIGGGIKIDWGSAPMTEPAQAQAGAGANAAQPPLTPEEVFERRNVLVFTREDLKSTGPSVGAIASEELPPEYFDLTPEDYGRLMDEHRRSVAREPKTMATRAMREREEMQRAQAMGVVHIRYLLPDAQGTIVQAEFQATHRARTLYSLLKLLLAPGLAEAAHLYTTPPKRELGGDDLDKTLFQVGLVPNANVHVGFRAGAGGGPAALLSEAAMRRRGAAPRMESPTPPVAAAEGSRSNEAEADGGVVTGVGGAADFSESTLARNQQVHQPRGVPKWLKTSK